MARHWIIRLPFLLILTFVVALWIVSYFRKPEAGLYLWGHGFSTNAVQGVDAYFEFPCGPNSPLLHFSLERVGYDTDPDWGPTTMGFRCGFNPKWFKTFEIVFPLWLPTLLLAAMNWFVWRKTRPKTPGKAFPVEPSISPAKSNRTNIQ